MSGTCCPGNKHGRHDSLRKIVMTGVTEIGYRLRIRHPLCLMPVNNKSYGCEDILQASSFVNANNMLADLLVTIKKSVLKPRKPQVLWLLYGPPGITSQKNNPLSAHTVYLRVSYWSENKQQLFPCRALADWFLLRRCNPLEPSGHYMYHRVKIYKIKTAFCPQSLFRCFVLICE